MSDFRQQGGGAVVAWGSHMGGWVAQGGDEGACTPPRPHMRPPPSLAPPRYPHQQRVLPSAQFQQFMDRIMEDTARRSRNKCARLGGWGARVHAGGGDCMPRARPVLQHAAHHTHLHAPPPHPHTPTSTPYQHTRREEIAAQAKADALAKLLKSAPPARPKSARPASASPGKT